MKKILLTTLLLAGCTQQTPFDTFVKNFDAQTEIIKSECDLIFGVTTVGFEVEINGKTETIATRCRLQYKVIGLETGQTQTIYVLVPNGSTDILYGTTKEIINKNGVLVPFQEYYDSK